MQKIECEGLTIHTKAMDPDVGFDPDDTWVVLAGWIAPAGVPWLLASNLKTGESGSFKFTEIWWSDDSLKLLEKIVKHKAVLLS